MLELNETMLEEVSGGWGSSKTTKKGKIQITNMNTSNIVIKNNTFCGCGSGIDVSVGQVNSVGNTSIF